MADTLNETLTAADFHKLDKSIREAFDIKPAPRVERLEEGFELYKLTVVPNGPHHPKGWMTPWWCPMRKFKEDTEGALGRFYQAGDNSIDMADMVRFMAAVRIDWNELSHMLQVKLTRPAKAFWGKFAPQPKSSPLFGPGDADAGAKALLKKAKDEAKHAHMPSTLGGLEAWQLYIPNLHEEDIQRIKVCDAHDMQAVGALIHNYALTQDAE